MTKEFEDGPERTHDVHLIITAIDFSTGKEDLLETARYVRLFDQQAQAAEDRLKGNDGQEIYAAARLLVDTWGVFGMASRANLRSQQWREQQVDRVAFGLSFMASTDNEELRERDVDYTLEAFRKRATTRSRQRLLRETLEPAVRRIYRLPNRPS